MAKYYIYAHLCPITNQVRYIGKGSGKRCAVITSKRRFGYHKNWLQSLENKGHKPIIKILVTNLTEPQALNLEVEFIKHYQQFCSLTNLTSGGDGIPGYKHRLETKKQQSVSAYKRMSKGVGYDIRCKKNPWWARIKLNGKRVYLGYFQCKEDAEKIYLQHLNKVIGSNL